jgi:hypothetical protein
VRHAGRLFPGRVMPMRPEPNLTQVVDWQAKGNFSCIDKLTTNYK